MTLRDLIKRTQVRSAALLTALLAVSVSALFALLIKSADEEVEEGIRARVLRTQDALQGIDRRYGFEELASVVGEEAQSVRDADSIFLLLDNAGAFRAGNVPNTTRFEGWQKLERSTLPSIVGEGAKRDQFIATWTPVSKGMLLVGRSDREAREMTLRLIESLGWGLAGTAAFAILSGVWLARRSQKRIEDIGSTLTAVASGELTRRVGLTRSDDDLDEVSIKINAMLGQLEKLVQNVNQSTTDIAHDLKKPMTRLRQRLESALAQASDPTESSAIIERSLEDVDGIVSTFDALLNIGQLEAGERRSGFTAISLADVLHNVLDAYEAVIQDSGFHLSIGLMIPQNPTVRGDQELLTQLFANLIENVLRHCPKGTTVTVDLDSDGERVIASISDNGPGIPSEEHENVLQRFYRLERARSSPGHGLGLSVVVAIADLHDASIQLMDADPGLTVRVSFPLKE